MPADTSVNKSWEELWTWGQTDPRGLVDYTGALQAEVRRLRDAAAQNSRNSSRPPATDRPEQPKPKSLRKKSGRKSGGQPGHAGRALLAYLYDVQEGASRRVREMCAEMFGYAVSEATLQTARQEQHDALEPFEKRLVEILPQEPILHADETSVPINQVKHWLHVLCTPLLTFFAIHLSRGKAAIQAMGIIPQFTGWLMHDFLSSYWSFDHCLHTFCKSHLLRELVFLFEQHQQAWANDLHALFLDMLECVKDRKARDAPLNEEGFRQWERQYRKILLAGRQANPLTPQQRAKKRPKQSKEQNLLDRLEGYEDCILAFLWEMDLPFTNNEANALSA